MKRAIPRLIGLCCLALAIVSPTAAADGNIVAGLKRALATEEAREGATSPYLIPRLEQLALAQFQAGDWVECAAARRRALSIAIAAFGSESASAAAAMTALAEIEIDRRRYLDAEALLIVADKILTTRLGGEAQALVPVLAGLARVALSRGDTKLAKARAERAAALMAKNPPPRSAEPLRVLGAALAAADDFGAAERVLRQAVAFNLAKRDRDGPETARSLSQLGGLYLRAHRFAEALAPLGEAAAIDQSRLGPTHPFIADDFHDLGLAYDGLKRPTEARRAFTTAIDILQRGAGKNTPRVAFAELELSRLYRAQGDTEAADTAFSHARRILDLAEEEERSRERRI